MAQEMINGTRRIRIYRWIIGIFAVHFIIGTLLLGFVGKSEMEEVTFTGIDGYTAVGILTFISMVFIIFFQREIRWMKMHPKKYNLEE